MMTGSVGSVVENPAIRRLVFVNYAIKRCMHS